MTKVPKKKSPAISRAAQRGTTPVASLGEQAYVKLKRMILNRELKAGEQVNVAQLSEQLGLGKNPIHLAAHRLDREGLIEIIPRKGILIRAETLDSFLDLISARQLIEPYLAAEAVDHLEPEVIETLESIIEKGWEHHRNGDRVGSMEIDRLFHQTVYDAAGNDLLAEYAGQLLDRSMRLWFKPVAAAEEAPNIEQLETLLNTMKRGDKEATAAQMKEHIGSIRRKFLE